MFDWAIEIGISAASGEGNSKSPLLDDAREFVDAWLLLTDRLVNVGSVLNSHHSLMANWKPPQSFDPVRFLVKTHKVIFFLN